MAKPVQPLIAVDLARFACAALVVAYHYLTTRWLEPSPEAALLLAGVSPPPGSIIAAGRFAWVGVQLFFVISGMVIAQSAARAEPLRFLRNRLLRLAPAMVVCGTLTALLLALAGLGGLDLLVRLLRSVAFWPVGRQIDPSYWTLAVELAFYLLVAVMIGGRSTAGIERTAYLLVAWSGTFWAVVGARGGVSEPVDVPHMMNLLLLSHGCFFAVGLLFTIVAREGWNGQRAAALLAAMAACCAQIAWKAGERAILLSLPCEAGGSILLFLAGLAVLASAWKAQPVLSRWIAPDVARRIGLATYPLYLVHEEAGTVLIAALARCGIATVPAIVITAVAMVAVAWVIAATVEPVLRARLTLWFDAALRWVPPLARRPAAL